MDLQTLLGNILVFLNESVVPLLIAVAFVIFLVNAIRYFIIGGASREGREKAGRLALWGILAFVIILSMWGIVNLFLTSFGISDPTGLCPDYNPDCVPITEPVSNPGGSGGV